jgi:tRNA threonylcarbamoyladenosine biosynthesis protein TsaE
MQVQYTIFTINEAAAAILQLCNATGCIALHGEMGAGKTTLAVEICKLLNIDTQAASPTYTIINEYKGVWHTVPKIIYHMDWYRLPNAAAIIDAGIEELLIAPSTLSIVEWASIAPELLPDKTWQFNIEILDEQTRKISLLT